MSAAPLDLDALAEHVRRLPGVVAKSSLGVVADVFGGGDWWAGPGDDGAVVVDRGRKLIVGGEAMLPSFVSQDPYGAGVSAVLANVNDLAAMGARPLAIVDTVTGPRDVTRQILEGLKWASNAYDVPIVGGHLTETQDPPTLSALAQPKRSCRRPGRHPGAAARRLRRGSDAGGLHVLPSFNEREGRLAGDVRVLGGRSGAAVAAGTSAWPG